MSKFNIKKSHNFYFMDLSIIFYNCKICLIHFSPYITDSDCIGIRHICAVCCPKVLLLCPTLCDAVDCSHLGSSVHEISQARILEWVVRPSSRGSSQPKDRSHISYVSCIGRRVSLPLVPPDKAYIIRIKPNKI